MRFFKLTILLALALIFSSACSIISLTNRATQGAQPGTEPTQAPAQEPPPAATCVPQRVETCFTASPDEPIEILGEIPYTSPFFLNTISQPFVLLEDEAGFVRRDKEFIFPLESQTLGPVKIEGDGKLSFTLSLPSAPNATQVDVDNNGKDDLGVQVFAVAYWSNIWGDPFLEERDGTGWSTAYTSVIVDPEQDNEIIGGTLLVWSPDENQGFPSGFGADGKLFTEDDPIAPVPAGYSLVDLKSEPFRVYKERQPNLTLEEGAGAVKDFSKLGYGAAFHELFQRASVEYPFTVEKGIDWAALEKDFQPRFDRVTNNQQFYRTLRDFAFSIPDGHVNLTLDRDVFFEDYGGGLGLVLKRLSDGRVIAAEVLPNNPAEQARILPGAEMRSWNGETLDAALKKVIPGFGPYSTEHTRQQAQVSFLTRMPPQSTVQISFQNPDSAQPQTKSLNAVVEYDSLFRTIPSFTADPVELPLYGEIMEGSGLGYIRINTFSDDYNLMASMWDRTIKNLIDNDVPGLVIDLRVNSGGRWVWRWTSPATSSIAKPCCTRTIITTKTRASSSQPVTPPASDRLPCITKDRSRF
ncbi:MAG: S41 family peptidase [Anaerolineales bacterium]|nr:S41 family peptidase [Anaerolineales bacterium]